MYIEPSERMKVIHIWIGVTSLNEDDLDEYFLSDESEENLRFLKGVNELDPDFVGIIKFDTDLKVSDILKNEIPINVGEDIKDAISKCESLGIDFANTIFYLTDTTIEVSDESAKPLGLIYIGRYKSSF